MWDVLSTLVDTTSRQTTLLAAAIRDRMPPVACACALLHGACAKVGPGRRPTFERLKLIRASHEFHNRARQGRLGMEVDAVRGEANSLYG
jgi:hypothetical protein